MTMSMTTSLSQNIPASATPSLPMDSMRNHTTALLQIVRPTVFPHVHCFEAMAGSEVNIARCANKHSAANPKCPKGIIQWQHGKFKKLADGGLELSPIKVDGRQMYSDPCLYSNSVYTRYNASEKFEVCCPTRLNTRSSLTHLPALRSPYRRVLQDQASRSLQIRWLTSNAYVHRLHYTQDASYNHVESTYHRNRYGKSKARVAHRSRGVIQEEREHGR